MTVYICENCGLVYHNAAQEACPVCYAQKENVIPPEEAKKASDFAAFARWHKGRYPERMRNGLAGSGYRSRRTRG